MPTPADAPYKAAQRDAELALRSSRRALRVDRAKLVASVKLALGRASNARAPFLDRMRAQRSLVTMRAMLTRAERRELGV